MTSLPKLSALKTTIQVPQNKTSPNPTWRLHKPKTVIGILKLLLVTHKLMPFCCRRVYSLPKQASIRGNDSVESPTAWVMPTYKEECLRGNIALAFAALLLCARRRSRETPSLASASILWISIRTQCESTWPLGTSKISRARTQEASSTYTFRLPNHRSREEGYLFRGWGTHFIKFTARDITISGTVIPAWRMRIGNRLPRSFPMTLSRSRRVATSLDLSDHQLYPSNLWPVRNCWVQKWN